MPKPCAETKESISSSVIVRIVGCSLGRTLSSVTGIALRVLLGQRLSRERGVKVGLNRVERGRVQVLLRVVLPRLVEEAHRRLVDRGRRRGSDRSCGTKPEEPPPAARPPATAVP